MKWLAAFCGLAILGIVVLADTRQLGFLGALYDFPYGDKVGHFLLFGLLSFVVNLAAFDIWHHVDRTRMAVRASVALMILIGLEELSQRWFPSRNSSLLDLAASYLGVIVCAWGAHRITRGARAAEPRG